MSTQPGPPGPAPRGRRWVRDVMPDAEATGPWTPLRHRKCAYWPPGATLTGTHHHNLCHANAVAEVAGSPRCPNHLAGGWVDGGVVWIWTLVEIDSAEREAA